MLTCENRCAGYSLQSEGRKLHPENAHAFGAAFEDKKRRPLY
jgi:hypothetical protein